MRASITEDLVRTTNDPCDIYDTRYPGLVLRVRPSGVKTYVVVYGRGKKETLGRADTLKPSEARELAKQVIGNVAHGKDPQAERRKRKAGTLRDFLDKQYAPWAMANRKSGVHTVARLNKAFPDLLTKPMSDITTFQLESWRTQRRKAGLKDTTINRDLEALRGLLSCAVKWGVLLLHPMREVKAARIDVVGRLRYLSPAEETRLRTTLDARDEDRRDGRRRFNAWRAERGYKPLPEIIGYPDHLTPVTLVALNTGLRRGEILGLTWGAVDVVTGLLKVVGDNAKSGYTRYVPLNREALDVLRKWRPADTPAAEALVFPGPQGEPMFSLKTAWKAIATSATLHNFTFHDLRHSFASKLVMSGVDLNTVRELLGHADIKMTLRYSHLSGEHKAAAVAKLVS